MTTEGGTVVQCLVLLSTRQGGSGFTLPGWLRPYCVRFACFPRTCVGSKSLKQLCLLILPSMPLPPKYTTT